jgi:hypothetical protein
MKWCSACECVNCNQALGNVRDNVQVLDQLQTYLLRSAETPRIPYLEFRLRGQEIGIELAPDCPHAVGAP